MSRELTTSVEDLDFSPTETIEALDTLDLDQCQTEGALSVLYKLNPEVLIRIGKFRKTVGECAQLYSERGWSQDDPEKPAFDLFDTWHQLHVLVFRQYFQPYLRGIGDEEL